LLPCLRTFSKAVQRTAEAVRELTLLDKSLHVANLRGEGTHAGS
jgi:hypothetical protein